MGSGAFVAKQHDYEQCQQLFSERYGETKEGGELKLSALYIRGNLNYLRESKWAQNLVFLDLQSNDLQPSSIQDLVKGSFQRLKTLKLGYNLLGNEGIAHLVQFQGLVKLYVNNNKIGNEGVIKFSQGKFRKLQKLALDENMIGDQAMESLINLNDLVELTLSGNFISEEGVRILEKGKFQNLLTLKLSHNPLREEGREAVNEMSRRKSINITYSMM